jgi:hypothetical protein
MAAVVSRALDDLGSSGYASRSGIRTKDRAMKWINGPVCEAYCLALDMDYRTVRERAAGFYREFLARDGDRSFPRPQKNSPGSPGNVRGRKDYYFQG